MNSSPHPPSSPKPHPFSRLGQAVGVQSGEGEPFSLLLGQSFFLGIALITYYAAANALFLSRFPSENLPYVYLVAAGVIILMGLGFYRLQTLIPFPVLLLGNFSFLLIGLVGLRLLLDISGQDAVYFSLLVWLRLLWVLGNLGLWTLANRLFTLRQGKRLFSLILAGGVFAIILTGFFNSTLIEWFGTANLIWISAGSLAGALGLLARTIYRFQPTLSALPSPTPESAAKNTAPSLFKSPYLWFIFLYTAFSTIGTYILDYAFIGQADAHLTGEQLGKFFGSYLGVSTLVTLLFLLLLTNRILRRFGVRGGLLVDPLVVGLGAIAVTLVSPFTQAGDAVFWIVVATKLFDDVTVSATTNTSVRLMYQPLPLAQRTRAQTFVESVISPLSMGISGGLLLLFRAILQLTSLQAMYLLLVVFVGWLVMGILLGNQYTGALQTALRRRYLTGNEENVFVDEAGLGTLETYLTSAHAGDVLMALTLLAEHRPDVIPLNLPDLLRHPDEQVRLAALEHLNPTSPDSRPILLALLQDHTQPPRVIGMALQRLGGQTCVPYFDHPNREIRLGALAGGLTSNLEPAHTRLKTYLQAEEMDLRTLAAEAMGLADATKFAPQLRTLLSDPSSQVRKAALRAATTGDDPELWQGVVHAVGDAETRADAVAALVSGGERGLPAVAASLRETPPLPVLLGLLRVCGEIRGEAVNAMVWPLVSHPHPRVRTEVFYILARNGYQAQGQTLLPHLQAESARLAGWAQRYRDLVPAETPGQILFRDSLGDTLMQGRVQIINGVALLLPPSTRMVWRENLLATDEAVRANALEILDVLFGQEKSIRHETTWRALLLAVGAAQFPEEMARQLTKHIPPTSLPDIATFAGKDDEEGWLAACWTFATSPAEQANQAEKSHAPGEQRMLAIEKTVILKSVNIFADTPAEVLAELSPYLDEVEVETGQTIFEKGEPGNSMYIVVSGRVRVHEGARLINELADRDVFGEMALLDSAPRAASVTALEPTLLLRLGQEPFYEVIASRGEIARGVIRVLTRYLRARMQDLGRLDEELKRVQQAA